MPNNANGIEEDKRKSKDERKTEERSKSGGLPPSLCDAGRHSAAKLRIAHSASASVKPSFNTHLPLLVCTFAENSPSGLSLS